MKIFTRVVMDWDGKILESESFDYDGPLALCGDAGLMGEGGGTAVAEGGGAPEPAPEPEPSPEPEPVEPSDLVPSEGGEEPIVEGAGSEGGEEPLEPVPAKEPAGREPLPAELAKSIKELKQAHPEQIPVLNALTKDHYTAKAFKQVYPTPDEAKADKVAIEALGGREGIAQMRKEVTSIEAFDKMASEGDPGVIHGLADQFPEGFKRLVPTAIERLGKSDPQAYRETLRGPLLQILEGDGLIGVIGEALDELKAGSSDATNIAQYVTRAQRQLARIGVWYDDLKKQEADFKGRYQDPRLQQIDQRERAAQEKESNLMWNHVLRELRTYLRDTMTAPLGNLLKGRTISKEGREDLEQGISEEVSRILGSNAFYKQSVKDLMKQGDIDRVVAFAKPHIDQARRNAINAVWTRRYGTLPAAPKKPAPSPAAGGNGAQPAKAGGKPIPVAQKPNLDDIDWDKDPTRVLFITNKAYLKGSGKLVSWGKPSS